MDIKSQRQEGRNSALSSLNMAIEALNLAKEISNATPVNAVFGSVSVLLTIIRDSMSNELDYVELGLSCADICRSLDRGMNGRRLDEFSQSMRDAFNQLMTTVAEIQGKVVDRSGRDAVSRLLNARDDGEAIAAWKLDLDRILHVFNTELAMNTHTVIVDAHQDVLKAREDTHSRNQAVFQNRPPGEVPPPAPRVFYGRDEFIERIVSLVGNLAPLALIGAGGIGKTSIALTVLHDNRIKERFGNDRRFIRCDEFPASLTHFLRRLSEVIGAGVENAEDLTPLRPSLSSKEMLIVLDNAESILDPQGVDAREIHAVVGELSQFSNICLCITSRISTIPSGCKLLYIPTLSIGAACDIFQHIYDSDEQSCPVDDILKQLDFHPLSIMLLATVTHHNNWGTDRLTEEWERRRTGVLRAQLNESLAATIELSLASPMFQELDRDARDLLGVVAFFPQGVDENNIDWLFPTLSNGTNIFDNFCTLSLTYRSNGFITMLAPLRDYLGPKDPTSSQLLCTTKDRYFGRLSVDIDPDEPGYEETQWISSEDVNIEHLLGVFTTADKNSNSVWDTCAHFMEHLYWHKPRLVVLGPKIEGLPDDHPSKPQCLFELSQLLDSVGNYVESKRLLIGTLKLSRERGDDIQVARTLGLLAQTNRQLDFREEGIQQAEEGAKIFERLGNTTEQAQCLQRLSRLLYGDNQLGAAEKAASQATDLSSDNGDQFLVTQCHRLRGEICQLKGEVEKAIDHFETALRIASSFNWRDELFWIHYSLAKLFLDKGSLDDAQPHTERCKSYAAGDPYKLGYAMRLRARVLFQQHRLEEAKSEMLCAIEVFEKLGATQDQERCGKILRCIQEGMNNPVAADESDGLGPK